MLRTHYRFALGGFVVALAGLLTGCGSSQPPAPVPAPGATVSTSSVNFPLTYQGTSSAPMVVSVTNSGNAPLSIFSIAAGGSNPGDFTNTNTCSGAITVQGTCTISVTFVPTTAGQRSETLTVKDNAGNTPQIISVSGTANAIVITLTPQKSAMATGGTIPFSATGDPAGVTWSLAGYTNSARGTPAPAGTIDASGNYTAPSVGTSLFVMVTATSKTVPSLSVSATVNVVAPGVITNTGNVQVARYLIAPAASANVSVQFGLDTTYGLTTWSRPTGNFGGPVLHAVAGMKQGALYHMRGVVQFADGTQFNDADQTFTTGALPAAQLPSLTATTTAAMTPQSGVELLDLANIGAATPRPPVAVTDLAGNVIWSYNPVGLPAGDAANPVKLLSNGHFLVNFGGAAPDGENSVMQEVDLEGNLIWQMTAAQLNTALAAATCAGCNITVVGTHHDFVMLPNGHLIVIASTQQVVSGVKVTGDVLLDIGDMDANLVPQPAWLWSEFDHLDINRRPYLYPDWTHTNAILYSPSDGDLIISIRHQNWLVKIDYNNGAGTGDILWHLGYQGDFSLLNADGTPDTKATDWFFAQHGPSFTSPNTSENFSLVLFDNGDDRGVAVVAGGTCGVTGQPACYSTVPAFQLDETAMTATITSNPTTPNYSFFGGNAEVLANGNVEYDECASTPEPAGNAAIYEVTSTSPPQTVWKMTIAKQYAYRGFRLPSLYPGVSW